MPASTVLISERGTTIQSVLRKPRTISGMVMALLPL